MFAIQDRRVQVLVEKLFSEKEFLASAKALKDYLRVRRAVEREAKREDAMERFEKETNSVRKEEMRRLIELGQYNFDFLFNVMPPRRKKEAPRISFNQR